MRRTGTVHCVLAFFFNTTLLALTIHIACGLFLAYRTCPSKLYAGDIVQPLAFCRLGTYFR